VSDLAPAPGPRLRDAKPTDAPAIVALVQLLGHEVDEKGVLTRINLLATDKLALLVATLDKQVVGLCGISLMVAIHRDHPVGRINILVVSEDARGQGVGRLLLEEAEARLRELGCAMVEITSNDRLTAAHAFYRHMGYERTSIRFAKTL
jgi:ribosomal protein S18 acetylase RimI-like enzyme